MKFPQPGIHQHVPERAYHAVGAAQGVVSKSLLWDFYPNPHRWRHAPAKVASSAMDFGSLVDALLLSPAEAPTLFAVSPYPEFRSNEAKAWRAEMEACGKTVLKEETLQEARQVVANIKANDLASGILEGAQRQLSVVFGYPEHESGEVLPVKARLDIVPPKEGPYGEWLFDLKTTNDLARIASIIHDKGYHVQGALYQDIYNAAAQSDRSRFGLIVVESEAPFEVAVIELDPFDLASGRTWYQRALKLWARCQRDDVWPSPWEGQIKLVSRPAWAVKQEQE